MSKQSLESFMNTYAFQAEYLLGASDASPLSLEDLSQSCEISLSELTKMPLFYTPPSGPCSLKEIIASDYLDTVAKDIFITNGAVEAIHLAMTTLLTRGDHVIVQFPNYSLLYQKPRELEIDTTLWKSNPKQNWAPDFSELEFLIQKNTKAIVISSPNNPTGYCFTDEDYRMLVHIARKHKLWIIIDEVYAGLEQAKRYDINHYERLIRIGSVSKTLSIPGVRIGWFVCSDALIHQNALARKTSTSIGLNTLGCHIAACALSHKYKILKRNLTTVKANLEAITPLINVHFSETYIPSAGTTLLLALPAGINAYDSAVSLLRNTGILAVPSSALDLPDKYLRIGFARANLEKHFRILIKSVSTC